MIFKSSFSNPNHFMIICRNTFYVSKLSIPEEGPKSTGNLDSLSVVVESTKAIAKPASVPNILLCQKAIWSNYSFLPVLVSNPSSLYSRANLKFDFMGTKPNVADLETSLLSSFPKYALMVPCLIWSPLAAEQSMHAQSSQVKNIQKEVSQ